MKNKFKNFLGSPKTTAKGLSVSIAAAMSVIGIILTAKYPELGAAIKENATILGSSAGAIIIAIIGIYGAKDDNSIE